MFVICAVSINYELLEISNEQGRGGLYIYRERKEEKMQGLQYPLSLVFTQRCFAEYDGLQVLVHASGDNVNIIEMFQTWRSNQVVQIENVWML
jgi:hypothetical protein